MQQLISLSLGRECSLQDKGVQVDVRTRQKIHIGATGLFNLAKFGYSQSVLEKLHGSDAFTLMLLEARLDP